jgi:polysaccharide export outer membrane protein
MFMPSSKSSAAATVALIGLLVAGLAAQGAEPAEKAPKALMELVGNGKSEGLKDADIRRTALNAGWDSNMVDVALSMANSGSPTMAAKAMPDGFRIGPGDVLQVIVWKEIEASVPETVVRVDGVISLPFVKEVQVAGLTPAEAEQMLTQRFSRFIKDADVTVVMKQINSKKIYLIGAVRREGALPIRSSMTVLQAIIEAGGLTEYAKRSKIYILRKQDGKQVRLSFDYNAVIKGERTEQNIVVQPDDSIVIPH